jgi:lysozyme
MSNFVVSQQGIKLIQMFESFSAKAYSDMVGVPTIGYGTTHYPNGNPVKIGDICTPIQAQTYLMHDLQKFEDTINTHLSRDPTQEQFDAMASLTYNIGGGNFLSSSVLHNFNAGLINQAQASFLMWNKVHENGQLVPAKGLTRRRVAEAALFGPLSAQDLISQHRLDV